MPASTESNNPASCLAPCPRTPNCVSTLAPPGPKQMDPIPYAGSPGEARERLLAVLRSLERTTIVKEEKSYVHAVCRSRIFRFPDDVEIVFDDEARQIHFRSAARYGIRDFSVNRTRMERIRRDYLLSCPPDRR